MNSFIVSNPDHAMYGKFADFVQWVGVNQVLLQFHGHRMILQDKDIKPAPKRTKITLNRVHQGLSFCLHWHTWTVDDDLITVLPADYHTCTITFTWSDGKQYMSYGRGTTRIEALHSAIQDYRFYFHPVK